MEVGSKFLSFESLEERALLSVSHAEYASLQTAYPEFELPAQSEVNVIEISADNLSVANLKAALTEAGTTAQSDVIVVRTTDAANKITFASASDELKFNVDAAQYGEITLVALGSQSLTLDAAQQCRAATISAGTVEFGNLAITNGRAYDGAGIYVQNASFSAINVDVTDGAASHEAGGMYIQNADFTFIGGEISRNESSMQCGGIRFVDSNVEIRDTKINENVAGLYDGGASFSGANSNLIIMSNCEMTGNTSKSNEGGIGFSGQITASVENCVFSNNKALNGYGGGFIVNSDCNVTLSDCEITGNSATTNGGGVWVGVGSKIGSLTVENSIIKGNKAYNGGGLYNDGGAATLIGVEIAENATSGSGYTDSWGGGIANVTSAATLDLVDCKVLDNKITGRGHDHLGGGVYNQGVFTATNSEFKGNSATTEGSYNNAGGAPFATKEFRLSPSIALLPATPSSRILTLTAAASATVPAARLRRSIPL